MARLKFVKGAVIGRLGEFVGSRWKGIHYIKVFTPPSNPRTEAQISVRTVFKALSDFASALFRAGIFSFIPPEKRMTERNSVFRANGQMLANKSFSPFTLQVSRGNYSPIRTIVHTPVYSSTDGEIEGITSVTWASPAEEARSTVHYLVYDSENNVIYHRTKPGNALFDSLGLDVPETLNRSHLTALVFCTTSEGDKKLISQTYNFAIA
jgi:hypothetical protein